MPDYDAFLLQSFGGPEGPDDVMPFLENVTRGRGVPRERLAEVAEHYYAFGGISPINSQCRDMAKAIRADFGAAGLSLPVYWGNRNWQPYLADTLRAMADDGIRNAIAFATSAYSSYSSCRQYLDDIERAREEVAATGREAPRIDKIRPYYSNDGFIGPFARATGEAIASLPPGVREQARLVFTAHSIPVAMASASGSVSGASGGTAQAGPGGRYAAELTHAARLITERLGGSRPWDLVFQSRSGPPAQPWLEPDICDHIRTLAKDGVQGVVVIPVGFVTDHMEVLHDLDTEAAQVASSLGLAFARAATPGNSPEFASMITSLVGAALQASSGPGCPAGCCQIRGTTS
jgi:protoporphyrin/coproporphyrin ferrochelatase